MKSSREHGDRKCEKINMNLAFCSRKIHTSEVNKLRNLQIFFITLSLSSSVPDSTSGSLLDSLFSFGHV